MTTDSQRLDFLIDNRLHVEKWYRTPATITYQVTSHNDECISQDRNSRKAIDKAMAEFQA